MDIVKRLRVDEAAYDADDMDLHQDAADEIERLRGQVEFERASLRSAFDELLERDNEIERLRHEFREFHADISMFMKDGPLKQDLLEDIMDVLREGDDEKRTLD
jgi:archaellum component FlaC